MKKNLASLALIFGFSVFSTRSVHADALEDWNRWISTADHVALVEITAEAKPDGSWKMKILRVLKGKPDPESGNLRIPFSRPGTYYLVTFTRDSPTSFSKRILMVEKLDGAYLVKIRGIEGELIEVDVKTDPPSRYR